VSSLSPIVTVFLPAFLIGLAYVLGRRELRQYRLSGSIGSDLFVYSRGRLIRRLTGVGMLVALAVTLALLGFLRPAAPRGASLWLAVILGEVIAILLLPIFDLIETARSARPGKGIRARDKD
jgi:hypothetical protein